MHICEIREKLTQKELKEDILYNKKTGDWRWRKSKEGRMLEYTAGHVNKTGKRVICINGLSYTASRLAFLYVTGSFPKGAVRHKNGHKDDDSWKNLQDVKIEDIPKRRKLDIRNSSGVTGVYYISASGNYRASITVDGKRIELGVFAKKHDAVKARKRANRKYGFGVNNV